MIRAPPSYFDEKKKRAIFKTERHDAEEIKKKLKSDRARCPGDPKVWSTSGRFFD